MVQGTSRNPEYNVNTKATHFRRAQDGKRLAPVSQYNSFRGRELAQGEAPQAHNLSTDSSQVSLDDVEEAGLEAQAVCLVRMEKNARPVYVVSCASPAPRDARHAYPSPSPSPSPPSRLSSPPSRTPRLIPPGSSIPHPLTCAPCVSVPGFLAAEFARVFDACVVCGGLDGETVAEIGVVGIGESVKEGVDVSGELGGWVLGVFEGRRG